jgi:nucleoside-diphosphate-sugar epimerase
MAAENLITKEDNFVIFRLASVFGLSYSFREDLLIHYFVKDAIKIKKLEIYEPNYLRNFIHIADVVKAILFCIDNYEKLKNNIFNLGSTASDITKLKLAKKIAIKLKNKVKIIINNNKKDLDQRDYKVSNKKMEQKGFKPSYLLKDGLNELIQFYKIKYKNIRYETNT